LFFGIRRRHREFFFCGNHCGDRIHHSGRLNQQADSARIDGADEGLVRLFPRPAGPKAREADAPTVRNCFRNLRKLESEPETTAGRQDEIVTTSAGRHLGRFSMG
jgi:hypothetical protein